MGGKVGKRGMGEHGTVTKNLMKNVRLLQIIHVLWATNEGGHRKFALRQQFKKSVKADQSRHFGTLPTRGIVKHAIDVF